MAKKISELVETTSTDLSEEIPIVQSGTTKKAKLLNLFKTTSGASSIGADDGSSGSLWTSVQGFINKLMSSAGAAVAGFSWAALPAAINKIDWGIQTAGQGVNVLRYIPPAEWASIKDGTSTTDLTSYIQSAINALSNSWEKTIYFPAGKFNFTRLYCVYDATNNPGFNVNRNGEIVIVGNGIGTENGGNAGTLLNSTVTTGDAFIASNYADDASPWRSRDFEMHNLSINVNSTGYALVVAGVPSVRLNNVEITQGNAAGSGLYLSTAYFGTMEKVRIGNSASGTKTGSAITFTSSNSAGLLTLRDLNVSGFAYGFEKTGGAWQNITISDSELAGKTYAIHLKAGTLDQLTIQNSYFEGACTSFLKVTQTDGLASLTILGGWMLSTSVSGASFDLRSMESVLVNGLYAVNQYTTFMNIDSAISGYYGGAFSVDGLAFNYTVNPSAPVYYFTGQIPSLYSVDYPAVLANCNLTNGLNKQINSRRDYQSSSYLAAGHMLETATYLTGSVSGGSVDLDGVGGIPAFVVVYNVTSPTTIYLPAISGAIPHGYTVTITNLLASTQTPVIKTAASNGAFTVANIAPGGQRKFVFFNDGTTTGWR